MNKPLTPEKFSDCLHATERLDLPTPQEAYERLYTAYKAALELLRDVDNEPDGTSGRKLVSKDLANRIHTFLEVKR